MFKVLSKFIQSLCLYLLDTLYSYKSLFHEYLMFNITKETTICNYGHVREIFSQLNIYASYLASLNFEFNDLTKFETSFMLNLENSQVMFFFLLVPVSSFLDFGDREELVAIVTRRRLIHSSLTSLHYRKTTICRYLMMWLSPRPCPVSPGFAVHKYNVTQNSSISDSPGISVLDKL